MTTPTDGFCPKCQYRFNRTMLCACQLEAQYRMLVPDRAELVDTIASLTAELARVRAERDAALVSSGDTIVKAAAEADAFRALLDTARARILELTEERDAHAALADHHAKESAERGRTITELEQKVCDFQAAAMIDVGNQGGPCLVEPHHVERAVTADQATITQQAERIVVLEDGVRYALVSMEATEFDDIGAVDGLKECRHCDGNEGAGHEPSCVFVVLRALLTTTEGEKVSLDSQTERIERLERELARTREHAVTAIAEHEKAHKEALDAVERGAERIAVLEERAARMCDAHDDGKQMDDACDDLRAILPPPVNTKET